MKQVKQQCKILLFKVSYLIDVHYYSTVVLYDGREGPPLYWAKAQGEDAKLRCEVAKLRCEVLKREAKRRSYDAKSRSYDAKSRSYDAKFK